MKITTKYKIGQDVIIVYNSKVVRDTVTQIRTTVLKDSTVLIWYDTTKYQDISESSAYLTVTEIPIHESN